MHRRNFLKSAIALAAAAGLPSLELLTEEQIPEWLREFQRTGELKNHTITLEKLLLIGDSFKGCYIHNVVFNVSERFPLGEPAIRVSGHQTSHLSNVSIEDNHGRIRCFFQTV